jgi:hypothetical protein
MQKPRDNKNNVDNKLRFHNISYMIPPLSQGKVSLSFLKFGCRYGYGVSPYLNSALMVYPSEHFDVKHP